MAVKYTIQYKDAFNNICRCDILNDNYFGSPIPLRGVEGKAVIISRDCEDDPFTTLIQTKCAISVFQDEVLSIDIQELQLSQDREFKVEFYINNSIKFKGFMLADGIQNTFNQAPFEVNINATDGISLLDGIPYDITSGAGQQRNIINLIRQCLYFPTNLNNALPIEWVNTLINDQYPLEDDVFSGSIRFAPFGEGLYDTKDGVDIYKSCKYIVEGLLKSMQCRLVQSDGKWKIWRVNDAVTGSFELRSMTDILSDITITTSTVDVNKYIGRGGNYVFIDEDQLTTVLPALKSVSTEYKQNERDNILPNGNMDIVSLGKPFYWDAPDCYVTSEPSLNEDLGFSAEVTNYATYESLRKSRNPTNVFQPFTARFEMSFYFRGTAKTGDIITMTDRDVNTGFDVNTYNYTVPSTYDGNTLLALQNFATDPLFFNEPEVEYISETQEYRFYWIGNVGRVAGKQDVLASSRQVFSFNERLPIDSDVLYSSINFGFKFSIIEGFVISPETGVIDWASTPNSIRVTFDRNGSMLYLNEFGFWTATPTDIQITVAQLRPDDVAQIDFNRFQNIVLPLPDIIPLNRANPPSIKIEFNIPSGRKVRYDDIYINVQQANDNYSAEYLPSKNTAKESYDQEISSSHNGFYVSNLQTSYWNAGIDKFYSDAITSGITLTNMNSQSIIRSRYMPSIMFEGSIYGEVYDYAEIYSIQTLNDKKFLPLKSEWNTETNTIKLNACEVRNDNISLEIKHNGINE